MEASFISIPSKFSSDAQRINSGLIRLENLLRIALLFFKFSDVSIPWIQTRCLSRGQLSNQWTCLGARR